MASSGSESIQWTDWDASAFERARELDRPVLLTIVASWCRYCRELDETTFSDKEVIKRVNESYLAVRVDKDRRPDINARYNCGGWPTVAFLTPDADLIAGESFLTAAELLPILEKVAPFFREHRSEIHARVEELEAIRIRQQERKIQGPLTADIIDVVGASIVESFDSVHGGFGKASKFPQTEAIEFALAQYARHGDEQMREVVVKTLDAMVDGEIHDTIEGGFFRYAQARDWRSPNTEKVLDSNAARLRCYLEAYQLFRNESYRSAADGILRWLDSRMLDSETGGFFGSQDADPQYYGLPMERRRTRTAPRVDRTIYADWNAVTASGLLLASVVLGEPRWRDVARRAVEFLVDEMFDEKLGVYHYWDGTFHLPGLLTDQAYTLRALTDAAAYLGDSRFLDAAVKLAEVLRHRHLSPNGGFYDISHDAPSVKRPARRNRSILENSILADAFVRLGLLARDESYNKTAREALESFTSDFRQYGYYAAGYARAVDLLFHPPLHVTIVGDPNDPRASGLRFAALATYQPNRLVDSVDPNHEPARLAHSGLPAREIPTAFIAVGRSSYAELTDPDEIASVMSMAERDRL
jgi:uncharacterized protein YyaL (SSP411 family)